MQIASLKVHVCSVDIVNILIIIASKEKKKNVFKSTPLISSQNDVDAPRNDFLPTPIGIPQGKKETPNFAPFPAFTNPVLCPEHRQPHHHRISQEEP